MKEAAYSIAAFDVDLGIPPAISLTLNYEHTIPEEDHKKIMTTSDDNRLLSVVLRCLFKTDAIYTSLQMSNFKFVSVTIHLGLIPDIRLKFAHNNES